MNNAVLSICIPTFNRAHKLERLLDGLLPQIRECGGQVNLFISDNASTDSTETLCNKYINYGYEINYKRNSSNLGADENIARAFSLGNTEYVWVLGDDDYVYENVLIYLVNLLVNNDYSLLYLKSKVLSGIPKCKNLSDIKIVDFKSGIDFARNVGIYCTFISGLIINKDKLIKISPTFSYKEGLDTNLVQLSWVFTLLNVDGNFSSTKNLIVSASPNDSVDYRIFSVFGTNLLKMTDIYLSNDKEISFEILSSAMWFLSLYFHRSKSKFNSDNSLQVMDSVFSKLSTYIFFVRPVLLLNKTISNFILRILYRGVMFINSK